MSRVRAFASLAPAALAVVLWASSSAAAAEGSASPSAAAPEPPRIVLSRDEVRPGEPFVAAVSGLGAEPGKRLKAVLAYADGKRPASAGFFELQAADAGSPAVLAAVLAVPSTARAGAARVLVEGGAAVLEIALSIAERTFQEETIALDAANTGIRTSPDKRKEAESAELWRTITAFDPEAFDPESYKPESAVFVPPVASERRTSGFGDRRIYRYSDGKMDTSIHAGIDYGVPRGTPVFACAPGRVRMARDRVVTGWTVIVEHLPGVFSLYYHLDGLETTEGALVGAGARLGLSGSTGLSTGPHLHWEIRVGGEAADGDSFLAAAVLDKEALLSKMAQKYSRAPEGR